MVRQVLRSLSKCFAIKLTLIEEAKDINIMRIDKLIGSLQTFDISYFLAAVSGCGIRIEDAMGNMKLLDDEEEEIQEVVRAKTFDYQFCLVGHCLTNNVVHFSSLRNTMADLWHPIGGICITELGEK
ncbi:hypothetical protein Golob_023245, partial [Gossypium lobatum]|nr:hypothetical protein [Gossypium lobatum]